ncbi:MAG: hypothetical protein Q9208_005931 [Pyrenodesmia sp. 3 TL-2023]
MSRAVLDTLGRLKNYVFQTKSRQLIIAKGLGIDDTRAAPSQGGNHDAKVGGRLDRGKVFTKEDGKQYRRYIFQLNKDAEQPAVKKLAQKDAHKVYAVADVPVEDDMDESKAEEVCEQLFDELTANAKEKGE